MPYEKNRECEEICTSLEFLNKECKINNRNNQTAQNNIANSIIEENDFDKDGKIGFKDFMKAMNNQRDDEKK